jgi:preprotein translocase subunit SecA
MQELLPALEREVDERRERVMAAGGLFICGTERHESRRIDNQLRGRAGRQGDPGESRFFLSAEDDVVRLFAGERIYKILDKLGTVDEEGHEEPIEAGMLSKQIEKAQRKVEEQHYLARKHTLEYDDVLNQQREVVYAYRDEVLEGRDISQTARAQLVKLVERLVNEYCQGEFIEDWDVDGLMRRLLEIFEPSDELLDVEPVDREDLAQRIQDEMLASYDRREEEFGSELMREVERYLLLEIIDQHWQEHLYDMDYLQQGIHLRGAAQIEPLVAYKNEAFTLFEDLMNNVWGDFARFVFHVEVMLQPEDGQPAAPQRSTPSASSSSATGGGRVSYSGGTQSGAAALAAAAGLSGAEAAMGAYEGAEQGEPSPMLAPVEQRRVDEAEQIGRNDPCWCGSGKKFKKCHGA